MTDRWPYWVVVHTKMDGDTIELHETMARSKPACGKKYYNRNHKLMGDSEKFRRCKLELEPIKVKP